ncbi:isoleucine--tRNA ligase [Mycoplasma flocculare]|uniref:Isoleucine--tRNA ligase n=1 Tax=Mesomycoplasma flocculare TaxID=2128 RepID=A0AAW9XAR7_MESFC|nr:isoleucine--tRNA ligase [Mesomycoplasma flocculare]MXR05649.1 isoleucine--tRNA ligase [Mesomycoplasma flocculare]MXR39236.1 isoleucine--tRNA ligase [Mycoplasma sp. MF12]MXR56575.1 isoleucine--tRNA ligase [Mesomycoplasma flocculare]
MGKNYYKNSLNIFNSDFAMKANLTEKDKFYADFWEKNHIYQKILSKRYNSPRFILHDGPPYANGDIHIGHALNKVLKDIIVRYKTMAGFYSPFVPGWDTHGLPIENKIINQIESKSVLEIRKKSNEFANSQILAQMLQFKKLNLLTDFKKIYKTNTPDYEAKQLKLFKKMVGDGLVYRALKPIFWSPSSQSALAEAEIEYLIHKSPSLFISFNIKKGNNFVNINDKLVIWTTTPWTLIANSGVAVGLNFNYIRLKSGENFYILAENLLEKLSTTFGWKDYKIIASFTGKSILGIEYLHPIFEKFCPVVSGKHVTLDAGSGLVHLAPLFGEDDYWIGRENNLEMVMHVNDDGKFNENAGQFSGLFYADSNKLITEFLDKKSAILNLSFIKHSFPHDWRTLKPVIYRGTPQWFVSVEKIKKKLENAIEKIDFPEIWLKNRLKKMIIDRKDWLISRQRSWGIPLIIFYDQNKKPVLDKPEIFDHIISLVEKHGSSIWYEKTVDELLPREYQNLGWTKENNILDVWFDSGVSFLAANIDGEKAPFDIYFEGSDQYRGWFNSSLINSVIYFGFSPYKKLLSHGFVVDSKGNKMSKSKGNGVDPIVILNKYGCDIFRLWVANSEYYNDVVYSESIFEQNVEIYRKIRNTIRFLITNLVDFEPKKYELTEIDLYIYNKIQKLKNEIILNYDQNRFVRVVKIINNFIIEFSNFYLSIVKDILYADKKNSLKRRQIQYNLYEILIVLNIAIAPIMPTTAEEIYYHVQKENKQISVHMENFFKKSNFDEKLDTKWEKFFQIKNSIYQLIEQKIQAKEIRRPNEVGVLINTKSDFIKSLDLVKLLMVAKVDFCDDKTEILLLNWKKCPRCWNHFEQIDNVCQRCSEVLNEIHNTKNN